MPRRKANRVSGESKQTVSIEPMRFKYAKVRMAETDSSSFGEYCGKLIDYDVANRVIPDSPPDIIPSDQKVAFGLDQMQKAVKILEVLIRDVAEHIAVAGKDVEGSTGRSGGSNEGRVRKLTAAKKAG